MTRVGGERNQVWRSGKCSPSFKEVAVGDKEVDMEIKKLMQNFRKPGVVERITIRPGRLLPVTEVGSIEAVEDRGLQGDRYNNKGGSRQVTLIQAEHLEAMASI